LKTQSKKTRIKIGKNKKNEVDWSQNLRKNKIILFFQFKIIFYSLKNIKSNISCSLSGIFVYVGGFAPQPPWVAKIAVTRSVEVTGSTFFTFFLNLCKIRSDVQKNFHKKRKKA
jgi:hypothetical protein